MPEQSPPSPPAALRPATYRDVIAAEAKQARVPLELALAIVEQESGGQASATSPKGAQGFFQLMPATAKELGVDPTDPVQNIRGGLTYFRQQLDRHNGDVQLALASYNAGPGAVEQAGGVPNFPETTAYVQRILGRLQAAPQAPGETPSRGRLRVGQPPADALSEALPPAPPPFPRGMALPPPPAPPAVSDLNAGQRAVELGASALEAVDPRTREGRRNIAGGVGAAVATAALVGTAPVSLPVTGLTALGAGVLGAVGGGMTAEAGEQLVGNAPPSGLAVTGAGAQQGLYEVAGQTLIWPIKALGRRVIASRVGTAAHEGLKRARASTLATLDNALSAASQTAGDVKALAAQTVRFARRQAAGATRSARTAGKTGVEAAETAGAAQVAGATAPYSALVGRAPSSATAGRAATATIEGPATDARNLVGKQVEAAAKEGPDIDIAALKAEAQQLLDRIAAPQRSFPRQPAESLADLLPGGQVTLTRLEQSAAAGNRTATQTLEALTAAQATAQQEVLKHPALGVLQRILNAGDIVPFYDAHLWKSELQNALQGTYDKAVKKQVTSMTQRLTGGLREALRGHAPYDQATAAYQQIVPLYTKEYAARLKKSALTDPESLIRMISPEKPTAARMLRDVLVTQSAEGGDAAGGQRAWDLVRSAWTHSRVLKGGIAQLDANLATLPQEFSSIFYGDQSGQAVLRNLHQLASAYKAATTTSAAGVATAQSAAARGVEQARRLGDASIEQATRQGADVRRLAAQDITAARQVKRAAGAPTVDELRFAHSTLAGRQPSLDELAAHGLRAFVLGPTQIWGGLSWLKLLHGPAEKDLLEWAAYAPANTQRLVRLLTGPSPTGMAIADVLRASGVLSDGRQPPARAQGPGANVGRQPPR